MKHSLKLNPGGFAISKDKLVCVFPNSPDIDVYNIEPFGFQRTLTVKEMKDPWDIVASENVLYVSEYEGGLIHKIQLPIGNVSNWSASGTRLRLSISKNGNVIISSLNPAIIFEYTSFGKFVRQIKIDKNLIGLQHAIQLEKNKFVVCHASTTLSRVCIIDNIGRVIKCYGGNEGSGMKHLNGPVHMAIGPNGSILVADHGNNRIVQLDASLKYMNEFASLKEPIRLRHNAVRRRLFVIEFNDQSITFLGI